MDKCFTYFSSPIGAIKIEANEYALLSVRFVEKTDVLIADTSDSPILEQAACQLSEYFFGQRSEFDLNIDLK